MGTFEGSNTKDLNIATVRLRFNIVSGTMLILNNEVVIMKTNQIMQVTFSKGVLEIGHKTRRASLTDIFKLGNEYRCCNKQAPANITHFLNSAATQLFLKIVSEKLCIPVDEVVVKTGRGKSARLEASLHLIIYAAEYLSTEFHFEVIDTFINHKILTWRDDSGDEFVNLNAAIDTHLPKQVGHDNKGVFIHVAKLLKGRVSPDGDSWNTASADQLRDRYELERKLVSALQMGFIRDWEHLKEVIPKI